MTSQCDPRRPNLNETKMRRRYDVACRVGTCFKNALTVSASKYLHQSVFSMFIYLINKMINCLLELAIPN